MINKSNRGPIFFLFCFILFVVWGQLRSCNFDKELKRKGKSTIGRIDSIEKFPKRSYICISFYINKKKYNSSESNSYKEISDKNVGRYYEVRYLPDSPQIVRGIYSKEIIDTTAILKAGFSRTDIENSKFGKK